jgi:hypothetical protein
MIRTTFEIITPKEMELMGEQLSGVGVIPDAARKALHEYQIWQAGPLNEERQKQFEDAVENWRKVQK